MLTDSDIHRIAGLLALISESDEIDVELGAFLYDEAAESRRDIDIAISYPKNGGRGLLKGLEVKNHTTRPLDSTHVEQLIQKMSDMPDLVEKGIVSASGYTKPAVRKAGFHGVDLYEIVDWNPEAETFDFLLPGKLPFIHNTLRWKSPPQVTVNPKKKVSDFVKSVFAQNPEIRFGNDLMKTEVSDLHGFAANMQKIAHGKIFDILKDPNKENGDEPKPVNVTITPTDFPHFQAGEKWELVEEVRVRGLVHWVTNESPREYKILRKFGEETPLSACVVVENEEWGLIGLSFSREQRTVNTMRIPEAVREKVKIFKEQLSIKRSDHSTDKSDSDAA